MAPSLLLNYMLELTRPLSVVDPLLDTFSIGNMPIQSMVIRTLLVRRPAEFRTILGIVGHVPLKHKSASAVYSLLTSSFFVYPAEDSPNPGRKLAANRQRPSSCMGWGQYLCIQMDRGPLPSLSPPPPKKRKQSRHGKKECKKESSHSPELGDTGCSMKSIYFKGFH